MHITTCISNISSRWCCGEWSIPSSGRFNRGRQRTFSWVRPRVNLDALGKKKTSCYGEIVPCFLSRLTRSPGHSTDYSIPAPNAMHNLTFIIHSAVLRQVHILFQSQFSTQFELVLPLSISSILSFL
jgi:hypothetical protein